MLKYLRITIFRWTWEWFFIAATIFAIVFGLFKLVTATTPFDTSLDRYYSYEEEAACFLKQKGFKTDGLVDFDDTCIVYTCFADLGSLLDPIMIAMDTSIDEDIDNYQLQLKLKSAESMEQALPNEWWMDVFFNLYQILSEDKAAYEQTKNDVEAFVIKARNLDSKNVEKKIDAKRQRANEYTATVSIFKAEYESKSGEKFAFKVSCFINCDGSLCYSSCLDAYMKKPK